MFRRRPLVVCPECQWELHLLNQWTRHSRLMSRQDWLLEKILLRKSRLAATSAERPAPMVSSPAHPKPRPPTANATLNANAGSGRKNAWPHPPRLSLPALRRWWSLWRTRQLRRLFLWLVTMLIRFYRGRLMISVNARLNSLNSLKPGGLTATPNTPLKENCLMRWLKGLLKALPSRPVVKSLCPRHRL